MRKFIETIEDEDIIDPAVDPIDAFLRSVDQMTQVHPFDHRARLFNGASVEVSRSILDRYTGIHISDIRTLDAGKGYSSAALKMLCDLADEYRVTLDLTAKAYGDGPKLSTDQLVEWYGRFGFQTRRGDKHDGYLMVRIPKPKLIKLGGKMRTVNIHEGTFAPRRNRYEWPKAGPRVDGLQVRDEVPNTGSISASFEDYIVLPGIREVPMSVFRKLEGKSSSRVGSLAVQIMHNAEINPLIVAVDSQTGPYILEGQHRFEALQILKKHSFPALVVLDDDDGYFDEIEIEDNEVEKIEPHPKQLPLI